MTVWQNTAFGPSMKDLDEETVDAIGKEMLSMVRLNGRMDAYPGELSGGMKQRNALARSLAYDSNILLLDEPLRALDARLRIDLRYEIRQLCRYVGKTTVHVTHDQEEALTIADRVVIMKDGQVIQVGTPEEIYNEPVCPFVQNFVGGANFIEGVVTEVEGGSATIKTEHGHSFNTPANELKKGMTAVVSIKHNFTVLYLGKERENTVSGKIVRRLFNGPSTTFVVDIGEDKKIVANIPSGVEQRFTEGMDIHVDLPKDRIVPFTMTMKDVKKDLEVV